MECSSNSKRFAPVTRDVPWAVAAIVVANALMFAREVSEGTGDARDRFVDAFGLVPYDLTHAITLAAPAPPASATLLTSQFLHASAVHLVANMLVLAAFGPRIEWLCGHARFVALYLVCGVIGGLAQVSIAPGSHVPSIGASGAIAGVLGAYILSFPLARFRVLRVPAAFLIGLWAAVQFVHGFATVAPGALSERGGGVAYFAHIGGFLSGVFLVGLFTKRRP